MMKFEDDREVGVAECRIVQCSMSVQDGSISIVRYHPYREYSMKCNTSQTSFSLSISLSAPSPSLSISLSAIFVFLSLSPFIYLVLIYVSLLSIFLQDLHWISGLWVLCSLPYYAADCPSKDPV